MNQFDHARVEIRLDELDTEIGQQLPASRAFVHEYAHYLEALVSPARLETIRQVLEISVARWREHDCGTPCACDSLIRWRFSGNPTRRLPHPSAAQALRANFEIAAAQLRPTAADLARLVASPCCQSTTRAPWIMCEPVALRGGGCQRAFHGPQGQCFPLTVPVLGESVARTIDECLNEWANAAPRPTSALQEAVPYRALEHLLRLDAPERVSAVGFFCLGCGDPAEAVLAMTRSPEHGTWTVPGARTVLAEHIPSGKHAHSRALDEIARLERMLPQRERAAVATFRSWSTKARARLVDDGALDPPKDWADVQYWLAQFGCPAVETNSASGRTMHSSFGNSACQADLRDLLHIALEQ